MIDIIYPDQIDKWNESLNKFPSVSVHFTYQYCKAFEIYGDGQPLLLFYKGKDGHEGICVIMKRDISECKYFKSLLPKNSLFDAVTPYGYGGFVFNDSISTEEQIVIQQELINKFKEENIISLFIRFSPLINNVEQSRNILNVIDMGHTIGIDLSSPELIWSNIASKNRNVIRKAEKSGVVIHHGRGAELINEFIPIYESTMRNDNANQYYYFNKSFYDSIVEDLEGKYEIFYAIYDSKIISIAIILYKGDQMEYHLSGSLREFRHLAAGNLLLYKAALWGCKNGFKTFHLGGGLGSGEDSLYKFKAAFNRNSDYRFSIGKLIVDEVNYDKLVNMRREEDPNFDQNSPYFPLYRS